jgi:hypothetical protein
MRSPRPPAHCPARLAPECVGSARRVVSLLWRDDLDTAFRRIRPYDRFGCPSAYPGHFRCLVGGEISIRSSRSAERRRVHGWQPPNREPATRLRQPRRRPKRQRLLLRRNPAPGGVLNGEFSLGAMQVPRNCHVG